MGRSILYRLALPARQRLAESDPSRLRGGWPSEAGRVGLTGKAMRGKNPTPALHPKSGLPDPRLNMSNSAIAEFD